MILIDMPPRDPLGVLQPRHAKPRLGHPAIAKAAIDSREYLYGLRPQKVASNLGRPAHSLDVTGVTKNVCLHCRTTTPVLIGSQNE